MSRPTRGVPAPAGGMEASAGPDRVASLTGVRAVAATLVVLTHAAFSTGKYTEGYLGLVWARLEIGVPIFFVLSGFLLFRPWVQAAHRGLEAPSLKRYSWHRVRRIMPAYVLTVVVAYLVYFYRDAGPNPGQSWEGFFRNLTLTQIYTDAYMFDFLHQGLTQMWSLAVEVSFYAALPGMAWLLLVAICRRGWYPGRLLGAMAALALISPAWLVLAHMEFMPGGARMWLPTYLVWFLGGMALAVAQPMGVRWYAGMCLPLAVVCFLIVSTPIGGAPTTTPAELREALFKTAFYAVIATLVVAPLALGDTGWYRRVLSSRPVVFLGEISYEIFLIHLITMEVVMVDVLRWPIFTGSALGLFAVTMVVTIPLAWVLHRFTRVRGG